MTAYIMRKYMAPSIFQEHFSLKYPLIEMYS